MENLYSNEQNNRQLPPDSHMAWAIVSTLLCCWPFGIPAIVNAAKVDKLWYNGHHQAAIEASNNAKKWANISAILAIIFYILYFLLMVLAGLM